MSAFVVKDDTINAIVQYVEEQCAGSSDDIWMVRPLLECVITDVPEVEEAKTSREVAGHVAGQLAEAGWAGAKKEEQSAEDLWKLRMQKYNRLRSPTPEDLEKLGAALFVMNVSAVRQNYTDDTTSYTYHGYQPVNVASRIRGMRSYHCAILRAVKCLDYQCSEGNVPEMPLYKALEHLAYGICMKLVRTLPEYEAAPLWH